MSTLGIADAGLEVSRPSQLGRRRLLFRVYIAHAYRCGWWLVPRLGLPPAGVRHRPHGNPVG